MYDKFKKWLDCTIDQGWPKEVVALNFNLYEGENNTWSIELVGIGSFDEEDENWACDEVFNNRDNLFIWIEEGNWKTILDNITSIVKKYIEYGNYSDKLKLYRGIGIGFVDGDIDILYIKN